MPPTPPVYPPAGDFPVALAYHAQTSGPLRPTGVTVLSIFGIVLASFGLLAGLSGAMSLILFAVMGRTMAGLPNMDGYREYMLWEGSTGVVRGLLAALLLTASIGCLRMAPWARRAMIRYAQIDLVWIPIKLAVALSWAIPTQERWMNNMINTP